MKNIETIEISPKNISDTATFADAQSASGSLNKMGWNTTAVTESSKALSVYKFESANARIAFFSDIETLCFGNY